MKPFWDEYVPEFDVFVDSDVLNGGVLPGYWGTDQGRLTALCNDLLIGRHPDMFPWPTQMTVPQWRMKAHSYLTLN